MITEGEWEAIYWYFELYSRVSVIMPVQLNRQIKRIFVITRNRDKILSATTWILYQLVVPVYFTSVYILATQEKKVPILQVLFFSFYFFVFFATFFPSYVMALHAQDLQDVFNNVASVSILVQGL